MAFAAGTFAELGESPSAWTDAELRELPYPAVVGAGGVSVEFPFGERTSLCRLLTDQPHPLYGNGLLVLQSFPVGPKDLGQATDSEADGVKLALSLNAADLTHRVTGYGFGSYVWADGAIHFTAFLPNALHKPGLLPNLYFSCAARAQAMAARFAEGQWDGDAYSLDPAVLARRRQERQAAAPVVERPMRGCPMSRANTGGN